MVVPKAIVTCTSSPRDPYGKQRVPAAPLIYPYPSRGWLFVVAKLITFSREKASCVVTSRKALGER
jgi:hypothetical protein